MALAYAVDVADENCMLRFIIGPSPRKIDLPDDYEFSFGRGAELTAGTDALMFAYGPVMVHEALLAAEILDSEGLGLKVVNMPWLNRCDRPWLSQTVQDVENIFVLEDHAPVGGLGDFLLNELSESGQLRSASFAKLAVEGYPACGTPAIRPLGYLAPLVAPGQSAPPSMAPGQVQSPSS